MLRYIKGNLEQIEGVSIYPIFSLLLFTVFFVGLFWWVFRLQKSHINEMRQLPLDKESTTQNQQL